MKLTIDITSDFICPWCYVAERQLAEAINLLPEGIIVETRWHPFEINPDMPVQGMDRKIYRTMKFGSWERSQILDAHTLQATEGKGIAFDYAAIKKTPNTFLAHRLMQLANREDVAYAVASAVFSTYFEQGLDIGDVNVLADIAHKSGMSRETTIDFLSSDAGAQELRSAEHAIKVSGVRSVPQLNIGGEMISGAQSMEHFRMALLRAAGLA